MQAHTYKHTGRHTQTAAHEHTYGCTYTRAPKGAQGASRRLKLHTHDLGSKAFECVFAAGNTLGDPRRMGVWRTYESAPSCVL
jgi:hypothetical protein